MITASWIVKSTAPAMKREPTPASVSSISTPSGVAIASRSSNATGVARRDVVGAHTPSRRWTSIASRGSARRAGTSSPRSCVRPARSPSGWAPRRCCGSGAATAPRPPTSRSPAGCSPASQVTRLLERLVTEARQCVYATEPRRRSLRAFLATGYWARVRERPLLLGIALALLFVPMALAAVWAIDDPAAALGIVPADFQGATEPGSHTADLAPGEEAALSSALYTNNIRVTFLAVAGGVLLGIGTAA